MTQNLKAKLGRCSFFVCQVELDVLSRDKVNYSLNDLVRSEESSPHKSKLFYPV